jgi:diguanylate cyclase (GGDEF)-like protein/PAS domain S-box-containing protein
MLDIRTLYTMQFLISIVASIIMIQVYIFNRHRFNGLSYWALLMVFSTLGVLMIALRGIIPSNLSIVLSNGFFYVAISMIHVGMRRFFGAKNIDLFTLILVFIAFFISLVFTFGIPSIVVRSMILSLLYVIFAIYSVFFLLSPRHTTPFAQVLPIVINLSVLALVNLYRFITLAIFPYDSESIFAGNSYEVIYIILMTMTMFYLIFNMIMVVSNKLYHEVKIEEDKFNKLFHKSPTSIIITRFKTGEIEEVNHSLLDVLKLTRDDVIGKNIMNGPNFVDKGLRDTIIDQLSSTGSVRGIEMDLLTSDRQVVHMLYSAVLIEMRQDIYVLSTLEDITEMNKLKQKLHDLATHDFLTHLPNRELFVTFFNELTQSSLVKDQQVAVAMLDCDNFKEINDAYGHDIGDQVLVYVAKKLEKALYARGIVSRFGGDEFAMIISSGSTNLDPYLRKLHDELSQTVQISDVHIDVKVSIGVTFYPNDGHDIATLLKKSDMLLYKGKRSGKNKIVFSK